MQVARHVYLRLNARGENADAVWGNEISGFLTKIWPGEKKYMPSSVFKFLAEGILYLDEKFPEGVKTLEKFSAAKGKSIGLIHFLAHGIKGSPSACDKYPEAALDMLSYIDEFSGVCIEDIRECLSRITKANGRLRRSRKYKRLEEIVINRSC